MKSFLIKQAKKAGKLAMKYFRTSQLRIDDKGAKDLVTEADHAVENFLRSAILKKFPDHTVIGEESGTSEGNEHEWIIDPIDGTVSFAHGLDHFTISIAYQYKKELVLGVVYAPALGEFYFAEKGKGASCNGKPIRVSGRSKTLSSVLATGFADLRGDIDWNNTNFPYLKEILPNILSMRRYGSAAYDLALTAAGKLDGFWELRLNLYDVAAGILLVREAGGTVTDFTGAEKGIPQQILATNGHIHSQMLDMMEKVRKSL